MLLRQAKGNTLTLNVVSPVLNVIRALPSAGSPAAPPLYEEGQSTLPCLRVEHCSQTLIEYRESDRDKDESPWAAATESNTLFGELLQLQEAQKESLQVFGVQQCGKVSGGLPVGLPLKRPHYHQILLLPLHLPNKTAIHRMSPDRLDFYSQEMPMQSTSR